MEALSNRVYAMCIENYKLTLRKFRMIKSTPKDQHYMFLPLTKAETVEVWEEGIKKYTDANRL